MGNESERVKARHQLDVTAAIIEIFAYIYAMIGLVGALALGIGGYIGAAVVAAAGVIASALVLALLARWATFYVLVHEREEARHPEG